MNIKCTWILLLFFFIRHINLFRALFFMHFNYTGHFIDNILTYHGTSLWIIFNSQVGEKAKDKEEKTANLQNSPEK